MPPAHHDIENVQRLVAKTIATHPAGHQLLLIGGFRYRLLDQGARFSRDIDYHWAGDLVLKQQELARLCRRHVIPQARRQWGYDGTAQPATGPESESSNARFVDLAFWKSGVSYSRIEIPLEVTRIAHLDPGTIRTADGIIYPTLSNADLIESKIIAVLNRTRVEHRDLVDLFLYGDWLRADSAKRLEQKLNTLNLDFHWLKKRLDDLRQHPEYHVRAMQAVIDAQVDPSVAAHINAAGGAQTMFHRAMELATTHLPFLLAP